MTSKSSTGEVKVEQSNLLGKLRIYEIFAIFSLATGLLVGCGGAGATGSAGGSPNGGGVTEPPPPVVNPGPQPGDLLWSVDMANNLLPNNAPSTFNWVNSGLNERASVQVTVPANAPGNTYISIPLDITPYRGMQIQFECDIKAEGVTAADQIWKGAACELAHDTVADGKKYSSFSNAWGTFDWTTFTNTMTVSADASNGQIVLGMQGSTGTAKISNWKIRLIQKPPTRPAVDPLWVPTRTPPMRGINASNYTLDKLSKLASWKANVVRWQLNTDQTTAGNLATYDVWLDAQLVELDKALIDAKINGIKLSIDLHATPGGRLENASNAMFYDANLQEHFISVWQKIATRYKNNTSVFAYELLNEPVQIGFVPAGLLDWRNLQIKAAKAVRAIDGVTPISVAVDGYDGPGRFEWLDPIDVANVIYSVHMYEPMTYTHQGVYPQYAAAGTLAYPGTLNGQPFNKESLRAYLKPVRDFQLANKVPIWVSEFSAVRWAPGAAQYLTDVTSIFEEWNWNWCYHSYQLWPGWSLDAENLPVSLDAYVPALTTDRMQAIRFWLDQN